MFSPAFLSFPSRRTLLAIVLVLVVLPALWFSALPGLLYYRAVTAFAAENPVNGLGLDRYVAAIEGRRIEGLADNLSGLTYSAETGTLFAVINRPPQIAELSTGGRLLRTINLGGVVDPEGITHVGGGRFIISDEGSHSLHWVTIGPATRALAVGEGDRLRLNVGVTGNMGFEGVSWDAGRNRLYVTQEMFPARVIVMEWAGDDPGRRLAIDEWRPADFSGLFLLDLSSASLHERTGNLLLLSHMSSMLIEYDPRGAVLGALSLWGGLHGLERSVGQAEGVAVGPQDDIFIVSEPNLFYRFVRK